MIKKSKKRLISLLFLLIFMLSVPSFFTSNYNNLDNNVDLKTSGYNTLFNGKSYPFELTDVYDDENNTKIYTDAYLQTEYFNDTMFAWNGTVVEDEVAVVNNTNYKSPSNTDVSMINGTFDDTDNMKVNDDSNSEFISTEAVPVGDEFIDTISIDYGTYISGTEADTRVDDGNRYLMQGVFYGGIYRSSITFTFDPALAGRDFYVSAHLVSSGSQGKLYMNGIEWKSLTNLDFDDELYNDLTSVRWYTYSSGAGNHYSYTYYFKLVEAITGVVAELNFTIDLNFDEVDISKLLAVDVSSYHYTNVSTTIIGNIYNYDSGNYTQMFSSSNTVETLNYFMNDTIPADYLNSSGNLRLYFTGTNSDSDFKLSIDYIMVRFYYKMDIIIYKSFSINGVWRYRFKLIGSLHYTDWTVFEVIDPPPNFYAISESDLTTRWILQNASLTAVEDFHDDIDTDAWDLDGISEISFQGFISESSGYLLDNTSIVMPIEEIQYSGTHFDVGTEDAYPFGLTWDGTHFWVAAEVNMEVYQYTSAGVYTGTHFDTGTEDTATHGMTWDGTHFWIVGYQYKEVYRYTSAGVYDSFSFDTETEDQWCYGIAWDGTYFWVTGYENSKVYRYTSAGVYDSFSFDVGTEDTWPERITWDGTHLWVLGYHSREIYKYTTAGVYTGIYFSTGTEDNTPRGLAWDGTHFWTTGFENKEVYQYEPKHNVFKNYFGSGLMYMQTNTTELISLKSIDYTTHYNLSSGDYFEVDFQTSSDSQINLILLKDGGVNKTLTLSTSGNTNFGRHTVKISVDEFVEFDQLKISSTFEDTDNVKVYDVKTYKYEVTGDYADFLVGSSDHREVYLTPDVYNLRIFDPYDGDIVINENVTIPATGVKDYVYTPIEGLECRLTLFSLAEEYLQFEGFHVNVSRSLGGTYGDFWLVDTLFYVDVGTNVYIEVYDRFDALIYSGSELAKTYMDLYIEVYSLKIRNEATEIVDYTLQNIDTGSSKSGTLFSDEIVEYHVKSGDYSLDYTNYEDMYPRECNFELTTHKTISINSTYHTVYIGLFTYDGLGINRDWVRLYINDVRADFGFNVIDSETMELTVLDYFNNTLANETIDASAYSEYNLYAQVYSMYILNQFTYSDLIFNITQVGSGMWMNQLIPSSSALLYRFIPNINYTINATYVNGTVYSIRTVNLTDNSQIESFGVPSAPSEYPKDVYFGVYTTTGLGVDHDLLRFYIDGNRADFGFNRIEDQIIGLIVKDYFNTTLFNQNVNTSGIYEYNILITLYSLKIRNEARISTNYTLKLGGLETTGFILPDEIIAYQLATNNYVFDYTNNEDNSFHTININLNQDRVYILNTTYYNIYFSLFDLNLHTIDPCQYVFRLNGTIQDFGLIEELQSDYYNITITDRFGTSLFNDVVNLRGLNEYRIDITLYELQIRHLASENSDLILVEDISSNSYSFIMTPDSIKSIVIGSADYTLNWTNGENALITLISIALTEDRVVMLNSTYYDVYFSLYDQNGVRLDDSLFSLYLNGTRKDFGFVNLESIDVLIVVQDYLNFTAFNSVITFSGFTEYNIIITVFELQIRYLAQENSNLTLYETTTHNCINFSMSPDSLNKYMLSDSTYNITWINGENGISTFYGITLNENYILTLDSTYYEIYFSLFDVNLHTIDPCQYVFRLNGTIKDFGLITDLQTDTYIITVIDRFGTSLFDNIVNLRGLNEYRINITLYELQIRHLARENSYLVLTEDVLGSDYIFIMTPDSIKSIVVGSADYTLNWTNGETGLTASILIALTEDKVVMLNTSYYDIYFSLFDLNLHNIDLNQYEFRLNDTIHDFGQVVDLQTDDYAITVVDRFGTSLFNSVVSLKGLNEYRIDVTLYELQIRHLAMENGDLTLSETTRHSSLDFNMAPNTIRSFILGSSTYNVTWLNNENGITTVYDINLSSDYILTLDSTYYDIYFSLFDLNLHVIDSNQYTFRLNGTIHDFGLITGLQTDDYSITVVDRFGTSLFDNVVSLRGLNEYRINITLYELQIRHLARENGNLTLSETTRHSSLDFNMAPDTIRSFVLGSSTYNITWLNNENGITIIYDINLNLDYILTLNTSYYDIYFSLFDLNLHVIDVLEYDFRLNGTIQDLGFIMDLQTDDYNITITDRFGTSLFNSIVNLRGLNEYRINICLYELQIRHLAEENSNLILTENVLGANYSFIMAPDSIKSLVIGSANYTLNWINGETGLLMSFSINLIGDDVIKLNTTYYEVYIGLYNFYGIVNPEEVKFYINNTRTDFGFNTIKSEYANLLVLDYFDSILYNQTVRLSGLKEYGIFIQAYTLVVNNLYNNQSITIKITRGSITIERLIEAQGWTEFKLFANIIYEISSYINGTMDEEKDVLLDEVYKTVDFGFYSTEVPIIPDFNAPGIWLMIILILMGCGFAIAFIGYVAYRYRKKSENYRRSYADKVTLEAQTIKKFSQGTRIR